MKTPAIGRQALRAALEVRHAVGATISDPICVFDAAEQLGIEVVFRPENSLGGVYSKTSGTILIPTHRHPGRQAFTCAHELGHWFFKHGSSVDKISDLDRYEDDDPRERLVNIFAGYLLMPPWAVRNAFVRRQWNPASSSPFQIYTIAGQLGVGYETLIHHLLHSLEFISFTHAQLLLRSTPKQLRFSLIGNTSVRHLVVVDTSWEKVAVDLQVGDVAIVPSNMRIEGTSTAVIGTHELGQMINGRRTGISRIALEDGSWATFIRISRKDFIGRSLYRHLEDPDDNCCTENNLRR